MKDILDLAVNIVDRLIALLRSREKARKDYFRNHIDPLFADMALIHQNYLESLGSLCAKFDNTREDALYWQELLREVQRHSAPLAPLREKVRALTEALADADPSETALEFLEACHYYFQRIVRFDDPNRQTGDGRGAFTPFSLFEQLIQMAAVGGGVVYRVPRQQASDVLEQLKENWQAVTSAYAKAKIQYLS